MSFSFLLLLEGLLAALYFEGSERYLLSLSWLALLLWAVYLLSLQKKVEIVFDSTSAVLLAFVAWMLLALYWHPAAFYGIVTNWRLGLFPFVFFVTAYLMRERDLRISLYVFIALALVVAALSVYQSLVLGEHARGLLYNKNNNAAYLNLALLPVISFLLFRESKGYWRWLFSAAFVLLFFSVLQTTSRGALVALAICAMALLLFALKKGRRSSLVPVLILGFLTLVLDASLSAVEIRTDLESTQVRWYIFGSTLEMIRDAGLLGAGNGMWLHYYPEYRSIHDTSAGYYVHNDYLQILYELGVPGFAFFLLFALLLSYRSYLLLRQDRDMNDLALYSGVFAGISAVAMHSMLTFNFYVAGILLVMGFYSGLLFRRAAQLKLLRGYTFTVEVTGKRVFVVFALLLVMGKSVLLPGYADAMSRGLLGVKLSLLEPEEKYLALMELWEFDPGSAYYPAAAAMSLAETGKGKSLQQRQETFRRSRDLLHEGTRHNRFVKGIYVTEAKLLGSYRDVVGESWREQAIALAEKDLAMDPSVVSTRLFLARLLAGGGDKEKALEVMLVRHDHVSNRHMSYYQYGRALAAELGKKDVEKRFADLVENFPDDWRQL
jgi:O-antigen ligase